MIAPDITIGHVLEAVSAAFGISVPKVRRGAGIDDYEARYAAIHVARRLGFDIDDIAAGVGPMTRTSTQWGLQRAQGFIESDQAFADRCVAVEAVLRRLREMERLDRVDHVDPVRAARRALSGGAVNLSVNEVRAMAQRLLDLTEQLEQLERTAA